MEENINKQENEEKFILEYPLNYNEIVDRKLKMMEREYEETIKSVIKEENLKEYSNSSDNSDSNSLNNFPDLPHENEYRNINEMNENDFERLDEMENENEFERLDEDEEGEFIEVTENNIETRIDLDENNFEFTNISQTETLNYFIPKSPIKNPEKIKSLMQNIHMNPPKWAEKYVFYINNKTNNNLST